MGCNLIFLPLCYFMPALLTTPTYGIISVKSSSMFFVGLWCFFIVYLTERCLQKPRWSFNVSLLGESFKITVVNRLCCLPFRIPNKWYPLVIILLFSLLGRAPFDMAMGYLVALVHHRYLDERYHGYLNSERMSRWESSVIFSCLKISSSKMIQIKPSKLMSTPSLCEPSWRTE